MRVAGWIGFAVPVLVSVSVGTIAQAACTTVPSAFGTGSMPLFHGKRGALQSPFLIPHDTLTVSRRDCDGQATLTDAADARVVVMLHPPVGRERAFVLMRETNVECSTDPFVTDCDVALGGNGA